MKSNPKRPKRAGTPNAGQDAPQARRAAPPEESTDWQIDQNAIHDILNSLDAGVVKVSKDGRIVYANSHARRLFDMPDREPVGVSLHDYEPSTIWEDGSPCSFDDYPAIKCLRTGEAESGVTIGLRLPGGGLRWVTVSAAPILDPDTGEPESAIVTVVDSSHPKHVEDSLRESEDRYRRLVQHAPDAIVVHRAGTVLLINSAGVKLYGGRSPADFIGRNVLDFVHPRSREKAAHRMQQLMAGQATSLAVQRHQRLNGQSIYLEVTATPCVYRGQQCVQVICRDVTRRRRAERALRRAKNELEERVQQRTQELSNKNSELQRKQHFMEGNLAAQERDRKLVAYEIHDTILQEVIGALMFLDAVDDDPAGQDEENARRFEQARTLLKKCIDGARRMISGLRPLIIDEQGIIGGIEYLVSEFKDRGLDVHFTHAMETQRLAADMESTAFRIVQEALINVERHSQSGRADVNITQGHGTIRLEVRDSGIGFDPAAVSVGHYGLEGLRERARLAGGTARIDSAAGKGTRVVVELPVPNDSPPPNPAYR